MRVTYKEPRRYVANAKEILREKAGREPLQAKWIWKKPLLSSACVNGIPEVFVYGEH